MGAVGFKLATGPPWPRLHSPNQALGLTHLVRSDLTGRSEVTRR